LQHQHQSHLPEEVAVDMDIQAIIFQEIQELLVDLVAVL
jgi:hypothetical protein